MNPDETRIVDMLHRVGLRVHNVFDLVNSPEPYPQAIELLVRELPLIRDRMTKEGVVRALTVKEASGKAEAALIREFERITSAASESEQLLKWSIGNALSVISAPTYGTELLRLATNPAHGAARQMIVSTLWRFNLPQATTALIGLLADESVAAFAAQSLGQIGGPQARDALEKSCHHSNAFIRKQVQRAIHRIDKRMHSD